MSELRYYKLFHRASALTSPNFISIADFSTNDEVYFKSEADKVIAEKDEKIDELEEHIDELQKATDSAWSKVNGMYDELRYQKFKRCLAMARIAQDDWHLHNSFYAMGHQEFEKRKCEFYEKWRKRWLELAEKFKEVKS